MTFTQSVTVCLKQKYCSCQGRASRSEYWWFVLFCWLLSLPFCAAYAVSRLFGHLCLVLVSFPLLVPSVAVTVRRLHDTGRSGWWGLVSCVPLVGHLVMLYFLVVPGDPRGNRFGKVPD